MHSTPFTNDLVLIGGGHSHALALRMWGMSPLTDVRLTLISPLPDTPYSGMLPGLIAGVYDYAETHIDLARLCQFAGARFIQAEVTGLDPEAKTIQLRDRPDVGFDLLSINSGIAPDLSVPGAAEFAIPVKPIAAFYPRFRQLRDTLRQQGAASRQQRIVVVGGGAAATELAFALHNVLQHDADIATAPQIDIIHPGAGLPEHYPAGVQRRIESRLHDCGIAAHHGLRVQAIDAGQLLLIDAAGTATRQRVDHTVWTTHAAASAWPAAAGLATTQQGFIEVDDSLRSLSHPHIFAAGDIALQANHPRPRAGVFAVRQADTLFHNWRASLQGKKLRKYRPQRAYLSLLACNDGEAVGCRRHTRLPAVGGGWVWRWKDRIDRRFMAKFSQLPAAMRPPNAAERAATADAESAMHCGGCGAKVGADILDRVLHDLEVPDLPGVIAGIADRDDASVLQIPDGHYLVQSVDQFRKLIDDLWILGRIAALHAMSDLFAMFAQPHSAQALITLPWADERLLERDLRQLLLGANAELSAHRCALVGGHTGEGAELSIGFAVNGTVPADASTAAPNIGDALIITKSCGTGTLFAAHEHGRAAGNDIASAIESMLQSNATAASILKQCGASLCTDVTGFGIAGHLHRLLAAKQWDARLHIDRLPALSGAIDSLQGGFVSSLQPQNLTFSRHLDDHHGLADSARFQLLFDPQTSGGLLACIPAQRLADCIQALRVNGYTESVAIGHISGHGRGRIALGISAH